MRPPGPAASRRRSATGSPQQAGQLGDFDQVEILDLAEINLPFLDEPHHPKLGRYTKPHTLAWANDIDTADALVIVTPEYNGGFPAPLKNALDFLHAEWPNKALGMVSYGGGLSGGAGAAGHAAAGHQPARTGLRPAHGRDPPGRPTGGRR